MKISTVAAKQGRKISERKLTLGLDLGDRSSWVQSNGKRHLIVSCERFAMARIKGCLGGLFRPSVLLPLSCGDNRASKLRPNA